MNRNYKVGVLVWVASVLAIWAIVAAWRPRYEIAAGPKGVYIVNCSTGEVWIRTDTWTSLGRP